MLAVKKHVTMSECILSYIRPAMPRVPNTETQEALKESREKDLKSYNSRDEFWQAMGIDPNA